MTQTTTALMSLLPAAGAVALAVQGFRRMIKTTGAPASPAPPQPREPQAAVAPATRSAGPRGVCAGCGTEIHPRLTYCAFCEREKVDMPVSLRTTALHWLVFVAMMGATIGVGWLISP